ARRRRHPRHGPPGHPRAGVGLGDPRRPGGQPLLRAEVRRRDRRAHGRLIHASCLGRLVDRTVSLLPSTVSPMTTTSSGEYGRAAPSTLTTLTTACDELVDRGELAGWAAGVRDREDAAVRTGGRRALDGPEMTGDTQFAMSSNAKPLGGALALRLVELGVLDLDDAVGRWLPELADPRVL